jgi:DNA-directed RNA polymerase specialized sigma24 family protein
VRGRADVDVEALDEALSRSAEIDPEELRYFGGWSIEEAAEVLGTSPATVKREWSTARRGSGASLATSFLS